MLDERVIRLIERCFAESDRSQAATMISDYRAYWECEDLRCKIAAIKMSQGSIDKLADAINLANWDLRIMLEKSGFGNDVNAHMTWEPDW